MDFSLIIILALIVIAYLWYVSLIKKRNGALEALSGIDVQLKMRLDLIPNILKIAKKFMDHEKSLITEVTELRTRAAAAYDKSNKQQVSDHLAAAEQLSSRMGQLMINVENYPELKSDQTMIQSMQSYNEVEAQISAARRFYNSAVTQLNNSVQIFPGNLIAKMAGVSEMPFFKAEEQAHASIDANKILG
jgi:LemA protein